MYKCVGVRFADFLLSGSDMVWEEHVRTCHANISLPRRLSCP